MDAWVEAIMRWLSASEGPLAYVVLGLAALIEYVVPPFPGDTVALFGVFLAATSGWSAPLVYVALNVGAVVGGLAAYGFGRGIAEPSRRPRWLSGPSAERAIAHVTERYAKHGAVYLAANRFVPALRAFFFVGAGIAGLPAWSVALWGGVSAAVWNALLLVLGWSVGANWARLLELGQLYSAGAITVVVVVVVLWLGRAFVRRRRDARPAAGDDARE